MSWLSLYKIIFMTELIIAELILTFHYPRRRVIIYLAPLAIILCYSCAILYPSNLVNNWISSSLMFILFFIVTMCGLIMCYRIKFINVLFCSIAAYTVQHISYLIFSFINVTLFDSQAFISLAYENTNISFDNVGGMIAFSFVVYVSVYFVVVYVIMNTILKPRISKNGNLSFKSPVIICFIGFALVADIIISDIFRYEKKVSNSIQIIYILISILLCVSLLCLQMSMIKTKDIEQEMEIISRLYDEQQKHFKIRKETIDLINIKCHDMKHKIRNIGDSRGVDKETIDEMQKLISFYDAEISTGNKTIDIILTEKNLLCKEKNIDFTCIVDGKILKFLNDGDLYALLGNILDNAVEAVDIIKDKQKRCIDFVIEERQNAIIIREDNYFIGNELKMENGLPITTKGDIGYHGYGLKSIREIVSRYDGIMRVDTNKNIFQLSIVFFK